MYEKLAILAGFAFVYSVVAGRLEKTPVNGPVVFLAFGILAGPAGFGFLDLSVGGETLRTVAELTLALVLFTDSANADLATLRRSFRIPQRMLLIGLPLTIALGFGAGRLLFPELPLIAVAILATILAPTDAALGESVVTNQAVPAPIREGLNVESGLNDGICVPILFTFLALAAGAEGSVGEIALRLVGQEIGIGLMVGVTLSVAGRYAILTAANRAWIDEGPWCQLVVVALAVACFGLAQFAGGSGFIACFTGGLAFGGLVKRHKEMLLSGAVGAGNAMSLLIWVIFGAAVAGPHLGELDGRVAAYAVLSLTVVRMLPVSLSLIGLGVRSDAQLFLGWFGPRGLASIVFVVITVNQDVSGSDTLASVVVCTVTLSIIAHGLTANPLVRAFSARAAGSQP